MVSRKLSLAFYPLYTSLELNSNQLSTCSLPLRGSIFKCFPQLYFTWFMIIFFRFKRHSFSPEDILSSRQHTTSLLSFSLNHTWIAHPLFGLLISQFPIVISRNTPSLSSTALTFLCPNAIYCTLLFMFKFLHKTSGLLNFIRWTHFF